MIRFFSIILLTTAFGCHYNPRSELPVTDLEADLLSASREAARALYDEYNFDACDPSFPVKYLSGQAFTSAGGYVCDPKSPCDGGLQLRVNAYTTKEHIVVWSGYYNTERAARLIVHEAGHWLCRCGGIDPKGCRGHEEPRLFGKDSPTYDPRLNGEDTVPGMVLGN